MKRVISLLSVVALLHLAPQAEAKDMSGRYGIGGKTTLAPDTVMGVNGVYWLNQIGLEGIVGLSLVSPDQGDSSFRFYGAFGAIFTLVQGENTHLGVGARGGITVGKFGFSSSEFGSGSETGIQLDLEAPLRVEHFFDEHFAAHGEVGVAFSLRTAEPGKGFALGTATGLLGSFGFTFYFL